MTEASFSVAVFWIKIENTSDCCRVKIEKQINTNYYYGADRQRRNIATICMPSLFVEPRSNIVCLFASCLLNAEKENFETIFVYTGKLRPIQL